jgi:hypothetical protein
MEKLTQKIKLRKPAVTKMTPLPSPVVYARKDIHAPCRFSRLEGGKGDLTVSHFLIS